MSAKWIFAAASLLCAQWTPELHMKVQGVGDVTPSPDGRWVAWTQTVAVMDGEKSEMLTQIYLGRADGAVRFQLTRGEKSAASPSFSPDSQYVYFTSARDKGNQVFRIPVDGGEAEAVTSFNGALGNYELSPNGKWIAFSGREADPEEERARREKRDFVVADENPRNAALWIAAAEPGANGKRALKKLAAGSYNVGGLAWSPDSRKVAFEARPTPNANDGRHADIWEVDVETTQVTAIAATRLTEAQPRYSPDGRFLAFVRGAGGAINGAGIAVCNRKDGSVRDLARTADESPQLVDWTPDAKAILYAEGRGTRRVLAAMPVDGPAQTVFLPAKGVFQSVKLEPASGAVGLALQSSEEPAEAYVMSLQDRKPLRVSAANTALQLPPLGKTEVLKWKSKDGREIEGLVTYPVNYEKGKRYPLILNIHGGPAGNFGESFIGAPGLYPIATFAQKGWVTLRPNPRGSTGYGLPFRAANRNDWGGGDYQDIMAGVDALIAQGVADGDRMAVMGWSYGGYMTNWVITQTPRFKAAVSGAGISSLISMWGTNDIPGTLDDYFEGAWYDQPERYVRMSPMRYVDKVTTPTMILHGGEDIRVPLSQGQEMFNAIKRRGIPARMVVYPRTPHGPREPKFMLDIMQRHIDWVEQHVR
jgi:dipeptidyl aminopeptidase/acylaminoacyl peptidase